MTGKTRKDWGPQQDLTALLDTLAAELLAASDDEVGACLREPGANGLAAVEAMRRLVAGADIDSDAAPVSNFIVSGLPAYLTRNQ